GGRGGVWGRLAPFLSGMLFAFPSSFFRARASGPRPPPQPPPPALWASPSISSTRCGSCCANRRSRAERALMKLVSPAQVFVVIAAYNEAKIIALVVSEVARAGYRVVVVDDGSADDTADRALAAGAAVLRHPFNLRQGAALQPGIEYALGQGAAAVVTFDADGQHRCADISRLVAALAREQVDFVLGSRFLGRSPNLPPLRRLLLKAATGFTRLTTGL